MERAHLLQGGQLFRVLARKCDSCQRRPGREAGTELWGHREAHSYPVAESRRHAAQVPIVSKADRVTPVLESS